MANNILCKSFNFCFSKFMCLPTITFSTAPPAINPDDEDKEECPIFPASTSIFKNFNSLYDPNNTSGTISTSKSLTATTDDIFSSIEYDSDTDSIPDFTSAFASHRFFFSTPGTSNSIFEPPESLRAPVPMGKEMNGGVVVHTYSPDPFSDFRKSMLEMIEDRDIKVDWEFLHELLLCYLTLNPKHTHKFIFGAFSDIVISLMSSPAPSEDNRRPEFIHQRKCSTSGLSV